MIGVSPDGVDSHRKFAEKLGLPYPLLADVGHGLATACGVWGEKSLYGKVVQGMRRMSFLLDASGNVTHVWPTVRPADHAREVLDALGR